MVLAKASIGTAHYAVRIDSGGHRILADEAVAAGGGDTGPGPYNLLLASLAACTAITLRMYADRKGWGMPSLSVELHFLRHEADERIVRRLHIDGSLTDDQRARLADIAERTPVTLTLKRGLRIDTSLMPSDSLEQRLDEALEESFPASDPPAVTPDDTRGTGT